eukprot:gene450-1852_t
MHELIANEDALEIFVQEEVTRQQKKVSVLGKESLREILAYKMRAVQPSFPRSCRVVLKVGKGDLSSDVPAKDFKTSFDLSQVVVQLMYLRKKELSVTQRDGFWEEFSAEVLHLPPATTLCAEGYFSRDDEGREGGHSAGRSHLLECLSAHVKDHVSILGDLPLLQQHMGVPFQAVDPDLPCNVCKDHSSTKKNAMLVCDNPECGKGKWLD